MIAELKINKAVWSICILLLTLLSCEGDTAIKSNPYLRPLNFNITVDTNLPLYTKLKYPNGAIYIREGGIKGFFLINLGSFYKAWEALCPNHNIISCSLMKLKEDGITAVCPCDEYAYNLINGTYISSKSISPPSIIYNMLEYMVSSSGSVIRISN